MQHTFIVVYFLQDMKDVIDLFEILKEKNANQTANDEINERLKNITAEVKTMVKDVADKMKKTEGVSDKNGSSFDILHLEKRKKIFLNAFA